MPSPYQALGSRRFTGYNRQSKNARPAQTDDEHEECIRPCYRNLLQEAIFQVSTKNSEEVSDLQREMITSQRQMCHQLEITQALLSVPHATESAVVKPTCFMVNENIDR